MNVIVRLEFELAYYNIVVKLVYHNATRTLPKVKLVIIVISTSGNVRKTLIKWLGKNEIWAKIETTQTDITDFCVNMLKIVEDFKETCCRLTFRARKYDLYKNIKQ